MPEAIRNYPTDQEIEVSLFGPGFGECLVVHLGSNQWAVIDSCLDKDSKRASALNYFDQIGVDPRTSVVLVVCTHWHDDHIKGIASVMSECPNAKFFCSSVLRDSAFLELVALGEEIRGPHGSGLREIEKVLKQVKARCSRNEPKAMALAKSGDILFENVIANTPVRIESLSPSDVDHERMTLLFQEKRDALLANEYRQIVPSMHPNLGSLVLRLEIGEDCLLLAADMEHRSSPDSGWMAIITNSATKLPANLYKIAHHGSATGDTPKIWGQLLTHNCLAILAPNQRLANPIPKPTDVERILSYTDNAYATAPALMPRKRLEQPSERLFRRKGIVIRETPSSQGHVRARKLINETGTWEVATYGRAFRLTI